MRRIRVQIGVLRTRAKHQSIKFVALIIGRNRAQFHGTNCVCKFELCAFVLLRCGGEFSELQLRQRGLKPPPQSRALSLKALQSNRSR